MKSMRKKSLANLVGTCALALSGLLFAAPPGDGGPLASIPSLDVQRYMGRWYEIAKFPNRFQKKCVADTTAEYSLQPDGNLQVINRCRKDDGLFDEAIGAARQVGGPSSASLKVRFAPAWLSFIPAVWGDYWVIDIDPDYQLVAVSEPKREYLWVLSRTPRLSPDAYDSLLQRLGNRGFDTGKLETTRHAAAH